MKHLKSLAAWMLSVLLMLTLALPAWAADATYTITINNTNSGHTYEAYQIFSGDLSADGTVLSNIEWGSNVSHDNLLTALKEDASFNQGDEPTAQNAFANCTTAADVADVLKTFGENSANLDEFAAVVEKYVTQVTGTATPGSEKTSCTISNLPAGYYLIKDKNTVTGNDASTKFILKVVRDTTVAPKSSVPTVEKKVKENTQYTNDDGYGAGYNDVADYNIGDDVPFKLIGTLPTTLDDYSTYKYVFHDTLSAGLTLKSDTVMVYVASIKNADLSSATSVPASNYTLTVKGEDGVTTDNCSFEISFDNIKVLKDDNGESITVTKNSIIIVTYDATLNSNAAIGRGTGNPNTVYLEFSNNPNAGGEGETGKTPEDKVIVFTYKLDGTKVDGTDKKTPLKNAEFVLLDSTKKKVAQLDADGKVTGWKSGSENYDNYTYEQWTALNESGKTVNFTSNESGKFSVTGLDDGTYYLREIKAPDGYNLPGADMTVVIDATTANGQNWNGTSTTALTDISVKVNSGEKQSGTASTGTVSIIVENKKGTTLPETGGIGTTIFYVMGSALALGALVLLVAKKRMSKN